MIENTVIVGMYLAVGFVYGVICHFVARSQWLRSSFVGGFIWPSIEYIDILFDNNDFVAKNSGLNFIGLMTILGGIKLLINVFMLFGRLMLSAGIVFIIIFLMFSDRKTRSGD